MKQTIKNILLGLALVVGVGLMPVQVSVAATGTVDVLCNDQTKNSPLCKKDADKGVSSLIKTIINTLLYIGGIIAVIMIIIGGIRYTTSNGDASNVKGAKDTILYAVVGLVVSILAFAIVNFVIDRL